MIAAADPFFMPRRLPKARFGRGKASSLYSTILKIIEIMDEMN
jgi:hypothetical protein